MSTALKSLLVVFWVLLIGLSMVGWTVEERRAGARIRRLLIERDERLESLRKLHMRYNGLLNPDVLERELPEELRPPRREEDDVAAPEDGLTRGAEPRRARSAELVV